MSETKEKEVFAEYFAGIGLMRIGLDERRLAYRIRQRH